MCFYRSECFVIRLGVACYRSERLSPCLFWTIDLLRIHQQRRRFPVGNSCKVCTAYFVWVALRQDSEHAEILNFLLICKPELILLPLTWMHVHTCHVCCTLYVISYKHFTDRRAEPDVQFGTNLGQEGGDENINTWSKLKAGFGAYLN